MTAGKTVGVKQVAHGQGKGRLFGSFCFFGGMAGLLGSGRLDLDDANYRFLATAERFWKESGFDVKFYSVDRRTQVVVPFPMLAPRLTFFLHLINFAVLAADKMIKGFLKACHCHAFERCSQPFVGASNEFDGSLDPPFRQGLLV